MSTDEVTYWSVSGQKLATYQIGGYGQLGGFNGNPPPPLTAGQTGTWYYFGSKMIKNAGGYVAADRLGSIGHFYPYGQEKPSATTNGTEKFTGYLRDGETGMDYADQRYHVPGTGRFLTPDPLSSSASPNNPGSWNRYAYVTGDPINSVDRTGSHGCFVDDNCDIDDSAGYGGCYIDNLVENPECDNPGPALSCDAGEHYDSTQQQCVQNVQPQPTCSITLFERGVPFNGSPANHTYLEISDPADGINEVVEGGPTHKPKFKNPFGGNWGNLQGQIDPVNPDGTVTVGLGGTNPTTNKELDLLIGGTSVCNEVDEIGGAVQSYINYINSAPNINGKPTVPYVPIPISFGSFTTGYNSNSFTYTLLYEAGLIGGINGFQSSGWTPGWGILVPGLY